MSGKSISIQNLSFSYPQGGPVLDDISLELSAGELAVLCGQSGSGKTTLLRQLKPALTPHGVRSGAILLDGVPLEGLDPRTASGGIGFVMQSPENQMVTDKVWHELAFGLESLGEDTQKIRRRVAEVSDFFGIQEWFHRSVETLSGGQKQLVALASVMVMRPSVLLLDEPTSQLDPVAAAEFLAAVARLNRELGITVLLSEHRLEEALPLCRRMIVLDHGRVAADGPPSQTGEILAQSGHPMTRALPTPMRVWRAVDGENSPCPVTVEEGRRWLDDFAARTPIAAEPPQRPNRVEGTETAIGMEGVSFRYERDGAEVIRNLDLTVKKGTLFALMGGNGAGKSTALALAAGLLRPNRGRVLLEGEEIERLPVRGVLGVVPQEPQALFVGKTVEGELLELRGDRRRSDKELRERMEQVSTLCGLDGLAKRHPFDLSGGEQQRLALAKVLMDAPRILCLDEPTKGLDAFFKEELGGILRALMEGGTTILMVSHDIEFCARYADRCGLFFDGVVVSQGAPEVFFPDNDYYTTAAHRMARHLLPHAVTAEDIVFACGGAAEGEPTRPAPLPPRQQDEPVKLRDTPAPRPAVRRKRPSLLTVFLFLLIPMTLFFGGFYLGHRKYLFIALLMILEGTALVLLSFEGRKPQPRELVLLATLVAIAVAGRVAFAVLPQFKPMLAIVIIAGVVFGGETGFLVGAAAALISNFYFGQGPFTPFQMFATGIVGLLAGMLFRGRGQRQGRIALGIYGALATVLIYGGILNPAVLLVTGQELTMPKLMAVYLTGLPLDLTHAASTAFFLAVLGPELMEKLHRVKEKYGMGAE